MNNEKWSLSKINHDLKSHKLCQIALNILTFDIFMCSVHRLMCTGSCTCLFNILANTAQAGSKVKEIDLTNKEKNKML